jgi:two-component sensor histidine kinase
MDVLKRLSMAQTSFCGKHGRDNFLSRFVDASTNLHGADFGIVQLFNPQSRTLEIASQKVYPEEFLQMVSSVSAADRCGSGRVLRENRAIIISDVEADADYAPFRAIAKASSYRAMQSTPMVTTVGELVGVVSTYFGQPHRPTADEMTAIKLLGRHAADQIARFGLEDDLRMAQEKQWLLTSEMNHRLNNVFTIIQSVVRQMRHLTTDPELFFDGLNDRIRSFASAQRLFSESEGGGADIHALVHRQLAIERADPALTCDGPRIKLQSESALTLGIALHELGTNARKHGAWTVPTGKVTVRWRVETSDKGDALILAWRECGGPQIVPPTRAGFGSTLLRRFLSADGSESPSLRFEPAGFECDLRVALAAGDQLPLRIPTRQEPPASEGIVLLGCQMQAAGAAHAFFPHACISSNDADGQCTSQPIGQ